MPPSAKRAATIAVLAAVYFAVAKLGLTMAIVYPNVGSVWPASAIGLAALLVLGRSVWPGILAGAFLVNLQFTLARHEFGLGACVLVSAVIAGSNALESVIGAWAAERFAGGRRAIESGTEVLKLALVGLLCTTISASVSVPALYAAGMLPGPAAASAWVTWWFGGAAGVLVWTPLFLAWSVPAPQRFKGGLAEAAALALFLAGSVWFIFREDSYRVAYLVIPGVIWTAVRFGTRGSALAVFFLACAAMAGTARGRGELATGNTPLDMLILQGFLATIAVSCYSMAALVWERERAEDELRLARDHLEAEVERRTRELVQAQKMEAVGRLSGVVAHEFKNALAGITGLADLIRLEAPAGSQTALDAQDITAACRRSAAIAGRLLSLSRESVTDRKTVDLNEFVSSSAKMLRLALGDRTELVLALDPRAPALQAAPEQLEQLLLNLCLNARDAMAGAGRITIATGFESAAETKVLSHGVLAAGDYVVLGVADTGPGIPEDIRAKIFQPFFSTKKAGEGTGLGLAIVHGIVEGHKGAINLVSRPGATEFRLYFPAAGRATPHAPASVPAASTPRGTETVLIADDDEYVRGVLARVLKPLGYTVLVARDGEEAWRLYAENESKAALAVLDVAMPKLRGDEVYARIAEKRPGFKVLFMSGNATGKAEEAIRAASHPLLPKPFAIEKIPAMVREILDRR